MKTRAFTRRPLSQAISLILGSTVLGSTMTQAAEQDATNLDEIVVTGIRSSLESSMRLKRDAQGVVDGIVAEDIGKFPDTNLAESLQRISGVSIDRSIGEGSKVTVRGVGPDFNLVHAQRPADAGLEPRRTRAPRTRARSTSRISPPRRSRASRSTRRAVPRRRPAASVHPSTSRPRVRSTRRECTPASASRRSMTPRPTTCRAPCRVIRSRPRSPAFSATRSRTESSAWR